MDESIVTLNVTINDETNEIEYVKLENNEENYASDGEVGEQIDEESLLVPKSDGVMTIKLKKKMVFEHICAKCNKTYKSLVALKRHLNLCRHMPVDQLMDLKQEVPLDKIDFSSVDENTCFCCLESKETAHVGHIKCNFCPKSFKSHLNLERHLFTIHSASTRFPCESCNATCPSQLVLDLHMESHNTGKPFSCQLCGRDFTRKYHLDRHKAHSKCGDGKNKSELTCQVCSRVFSRIDNLREHLRGHMGKAIRRRDYLCPYCDKSFYGSSLLNIHIRTHTGEKPFLCDLCDKSFPSNGALRKHRRMHTGEKPYTCSVCTKCFAAKETLNRHVKIHTGVRPHACNVCGRTFIQSTQLRSHMFQHTGENGFRCTFCERVFTRKSRLEKHIKQTHEESEADQMSCGICQKTFVRRDDYYRHKASHSTTVFRCDVCDKTYSTNSALNVHKKIHSNKDPCMCKICKKMFIRKDCLTRHMRNKHKDIISDIIGETEVKKMKKMLTVKSAETVCKAKLLPTKIEITEDEEEEDDEEVDIHCSESQAEDADVNEYHIIFPNESNFESTKSEFLVVKQEKDQIINFSDDELTEKVKQLLNLLIDEDTLREFGWPEKSVEDVLNLVIEQCGTVPADYTTCPDYATKMRENTKLLFTTVVDNESIKELLNNQTIDEVILHVLKTAG